MHTVKKRGEYNQRQEPGSSLADTPEESRETGTELKNNYADQGHKYNNNADSKFLHTIKELPAL